MEIGIITEILNTFIGAFSGGFERLRPAIGALLRIFLTLDVLFFLILVVFDLEQVRSAFKKILVLSIWIYVIRDFDRHATSVVTSLVQGGLMAAGKGGADPHVLLDPSRILEISFSATQVLAENLRNAGPLDLMDIISAGFAYIFIMLSFGALALNAFIAVIEYYLALAVSGLLIPFALLGPTRWIAMKPISFLVASGIKLMVIAFILAISDDVLGRVRFASDEPSLREIWVMMCVSGMLAMVAWIAPQRFAQGFMAGSASLGGSDAIMVAASAARALPAAALAPSSAASSGLRAASAAGGFVQGIWQGHQGSAAAASAPAASSERGGRAGPGGGSGRAGPLMASSVTSSHREPPAGPELGTAPSDARKANTA